MAGGEAVHRRPRHPELRRAAAGGAPASWGGDEEPVEEADPEAHLAQED